MAQPRKISTEVSQEKTVSKATSSNGTTSTEMEKESCDDTSDSRQEATTNSLIMAGKNRRKIRQPKQYKPSSMHDTEGCNGNNEEQPVAGEEPNEARSMDKQLEEEPSSDVKMTEDFSTGNTEKTVHVMTASLAPKQKAVSSSTSKTPGSKSSKKTSGKRAKHPNPRVPMKPEDLVKESLTDPKASAQGARRDAQYRKSYAYKIWREREINEVSGPEPPGNKRQANNGQAGRPAGNIQQNNIAYYGPRNSTGFYANGQYYEMNPPQIIHGVNRGPQLPPTTQVIPRPPQAVTTPAHATYPNHSVTSQLQVHPGIISNATYYRGENADVHNVIKIDDYPMPVSTDVHRIHKSSPKSSEGYINPKKPQEVTVYPASSPGEGRTSAQEKITQSETTIKQKTTTQQNRESTGECSSPSDVVTVMKTSLRKKYSKENIKPLVSSAKLKSKRKLESAEKSEFITPRKSAKSTIFTPLNEQEAEKLANDIYDVNLEYFPIQTLAEKAAQAKDEKDEKTTTKTNKVEIEKVRYLLKDFYDVTRSCAEDADMQKFDSASRKFGRKNILNHLALLDRYFAELQKKIEDTAVCNE